MSAPLEAWRVCARHPGAERDAVRDVTLSVQAGEIVALVGANGSGKSTLMAALAGTLRARSGQVSIDGEPLRALRPRERARRIARLPQDPVAVPGICIEELVHMGRHARRAPLAGLSRDDRRAVRDALAAVGLEDLRSRPIERVSGGERRRAWIAMVLAQEAPVMLLDEPTAALDLRHQLEVLEHLARINREQGAALIVALHDLDQAALLADRVAVMARGRLYAAGPPREVLTPETLRDTFGIESELEHAPRMHVRVTGIADPERNL